MTVTEAVENLRICEQELEAADFVCRLWTRAHGFAVWRQGHPSDRAKLRRRRYAKLDLKRARWYLDYALSQAAPATREVH